MWTNCIKKEADDTTYHIYIYIYKLELDEGLEPKTVTKSIFNSLEVCYIDEDSEEEEEEDNDNAPAEEEAQWCAASASLPRNSYARAMTNGVIPGDRRERGNATLEDQQPLSLPPLKLTSAGRCLDRFSSCIKIPRVMLSHQGGASWEFPVLPRLSGRITASNPPGVLQGTLKMRALRDNSQNV